MIVNEDAGNYYLKIAEKDVISTSAHFVVGATMSDRFGEITAWFNSQPYHTAPLALNLVHKALFHALLGDDYNIEVINKPFPFIESSKELELSNSVFSVAVMVNLSLAMAFVTAFYVMYYIKVRVFSSIYYGK